VGNENSRDRSFDVMRTYLADVLGKRRFDLIPEFAAEDMIDHTQSKRGPAALDAHARGFCDNIDDLEIEVVRIIATEDSAVGIWRWHGTPNRPMGVSATGNPIHPRLIASIFDFDAGMLVEYRPFIDAVDVATQLARRPAD
jgi:predicted ester cyclase